MDTENAVVTVQTDTQLTQRRILRGHMTIFRLTALFALITLAGCNSTTTANTSSTPQQLAFAQNLQPFLFEREAFPSGTSFQIIEVTEGNFGVWTSNVESTGILLINVPIRLGMRLDSNLGV
jgi:hypothetical protein